jgi:uncharacterized protein YbjT (DUF2867 family)
MSPVGPIAVTGATGYVGSRVARLLADAGAAQRLLVRDAARAPQLAGAQVATIPDLAAEDAVREALRGASTLFLVPAHESPDRVAGHAAAIRAAVAAGVGRIVYLSFVGAREDATFTLVRDHWATEELVRRAGLAWTFVRMNLYADFLPMMAGEDGVLRGPAGHGRFTPVVRDDVAAACAAVLTGSGHDGRAYDVVGPERLTMDDVAATITRVTGRSVVFEDETEEQARASRAHYGAPEWELQAWISTYLAVRDGSLDLASPDFATLVGRPATSLAEHLAAG